MASSAQNFAHKDYRWPTKWCASGGGVCDQIFQGSLAAYPTTSHPADSTRKPPRLSPADRAHLKRWADDERADKVWSTINRAAQKRGRVIPDRFFIQQVLGARDIAASINHRRKHRDQYRKYAAQMERNAKTLRQRLPNGLTLIPNGDELAQKLDDATETMPPFLGTCPALSNGPANLDHAMFS